MEIFRSQMWGILLDQLNAESIFLVPPLCAGGKNCQPSEKIRATQGPGLTGEVHLLHDTKQQQCKWIIAQSPAPLCTRQTFGALPRALWCNQMQPVLAACKNCNRRRSFCRVCVDKEPPSCIAHTVSPWRRVCKCFRWCCVAPTFTSFWNFFTFCDFLNGLIYVQDP